MQYSLRPKKRFDERGINMKLIVNADDFGITKAVTLGILEAHEQGVLTSTTLMCNMPDAEYAAGLSKNYPKLGVGIHFVLTAGFPLAEGVNSLVDETGRFHKIDKIKELATSEDIRKEFRRQMDKFLSFGIKPTHIDSHHHVHGISKVLEIVREFAVEYDIPVRLLGEVCENYLKGIATTEGFTGGFYGNTEINPEGLINSIEKNKNFESLEIMCHPGYLDQAILDMSSYAMPRTQELTTLTSDIVKNYIKENNIQLINFKAIK
ncbi:hypothetical protein CLVI_26580 [Clostridium vincentii]|uniref:Carbohydrate deacetylase n=2 Tax=Clostridium vincentii TaxID=52704 RepID=A0A2T0BBG3_9CLOT|nr:hypothetical protein CLVI_26580 [Clostridium vincentii]